MRVLFAHNAYQQRGGEDFAVEREIELLRERRHQISTVFVSNDDISNMSRARLAADTLWSSSSKRSLKERLQSKARRGSFSQYLTAHLPGGLLRRSF